MACDILYKGKLYTQEDFKKLLTEGELESILKQFPDILNIKANAIQKPSAKSVLQREQREAGEARGGREGVESVEQRVETAEKAKKAESNGEAVVYPRSISIEHAETEKLREEFGLEPRTLREVVTDEELKAKAIQEIKNGYSVNRLISKMLAGDYTPSALEVAILRQYIANLDQELRTLEPSSKDFADVLEKQTKAFQASEKSGSEQGAAFRQRRIDALAEDTLTSMLMREKEVSQSDDLTQEQIAKVKEEYEEIKKAKEEWENKYKKLEEQVLLKEAQKAVFKAKSEAKKKSKEQIQKERDSIKQSIKDKWKKAGNDGTLMAIPVPYAKQLAAISPDVAKLMRSYVEEGVTELKDIVSKIKDDIGDVVPDIQESDIRDIIAGAYNEKRTKSDIENTVRDLKQEAKLIKQIEDFKSGKQPTTEQGRREANKKITELRKELRSLEAERASLEADGVENAEQKALNNIKKRTEKQIEELEEKLRIGDFAKKPKAEVKLDKEAIDLKDRLIKLRKEREIRLFKEEYKNRTKLQKGVDAVSEVLNVPRSAVASIDLSAFLRQGVIPSFSHPILASKAFIESLRQAFSQKRFDRYFYDLAESPDYKAMKDAGLFIADPRDPHLTAKEEVFMSNLAEKIPYIGGPSNLHRFLGLGNKKVGGLIKGSERAYVAFLNKMRVDLFKNGMDAIKAAKKEDGVTPDDAKAWASFVNNSTGRGTMPKAIESAAPILNATFFSPKLIFSRLNLLNPVYYAKLPPEVQKMALKDMGIFLSVGASILALAKLNGADVEDDSRSPNFGKIRFGNDVYDIWGGFQQYIVEIAQLIRGETKSAKSGQIREFSPDKFPFVTRGSDLGSFFRNKLAPVPATTVNLLTGKNAIGEKTNIKKEAISLVAPLTAKEFYEAYSREGISGAFAVSPSIFGIGYQDLSEMKEEDSRGKRRSEKRGEKRSGNRRSENEEED